MLCLKILSLEENQPFGGVPLSDKPSYFKLGLSLENRPSVSSQGPWLLTEIAIFLNNFFKIQKFKNSKKKPYKFWLLRHCYCIFSLVDIGKKWFFKQKKINFRIVQLLLERPSIGSKFSLMSCTLLLANLRSLIANMNSKFTNYFICGK